MVLDPRIFPRPDSVGLVVMGVAYSIKLRPAENIDAAASRGHSRLDSVKCIRSPVLVKRVRQEQSLIDSITQTGIR